MSSARYWLTCAAAEDLAGIVKYTIETWGEEQLILYRQRLEQRLALLVEFPDMGRNHPMLRSHFRYVVEGKHYIFYRSVAGGIEVLRFLHCRSDIIANLSVYL